MTTSNKPGGVKLTKKSLNDFIGWTKSRYNNYLGFGTKKENLDIIFNSIKKGYYVGRHGKENLDKTTFEVECASPVGESGTNKRGSYWSTKQAGDHYTIDCVNKSIVAKYSKREIFFI